MVEAQLMRQSQPLAAPERQMHPLVWMASGAGLLALGLALGKLI